MHPDPHQRARFLADEALVAGISREDERWLRSHTESCAECAAHAELTSRLVRSLNSFSFEIDPGRRRRVQDAVAIHAQQLATNRRHFQVRLWRWSLIAATLILVTTPIYTNIRYKQQASEEEQADALLLKRVDASVSRDVPKAMELLMPGEVR